MMSLPVSLLGPMFLLGWGGLCLWSHVPSGGSLSRGVSVRETPGQRPPPLPRTIKSGKYAYYWNAFLFEVDTAQLLFS